MGDTIERRWTSKGITYSERGTVAKIDGAWALGAEGGVLASQYGGKSSLFLIERPKPPLPTEPGSRINNVVLGDGERFPYAIHTFAPEGSGTRYEWVGFAFFGFTQDFDSNDITSWEPA